MLEIICVALCYMAALINASLAVRDHSLTYSFSAVLMAVAGTLLLI